jgi:hypothetical protein
MHDGTREQMERYVSISGHVYWKDELHTNGLHFCFVTLELSFHLKTA